MNIKRITRWLRPYNEATERMRYCTKCGDILDCVQECCGKDDKARYKYVPSSVGNVSNLEWCLYEMRRIMDKKFDAHLRQSRKGIALFRELYAYESPNDADAEIGSKVCAIEDVKDMYDESSDWPDDSETEPDGDIGVAL